MPYNEVDEVDLEYGIETRTPNDGEDDKDDEQDKEKEAY